MPKGVGSVFRQKYKGGESKTWYVEFRGPDGKPVRESSKSTKRSEAVNLLKKRNQEVLDGVYRPKADETFDTMAERIRDDYRANGQNVDTLNRVLKRLEKNGWKEQPLSAFTRDAINKYKLSRSEKAAAATVNREISALTRMLSLIDRPVRVPRLKENNARSGFFGQDEFERVVALLPKPLQPVARVAYITGWRVHSEIITRQWPHVDKTGMMLRLEVGESKNKEARLFPIMGELEQILDHQRAYTDGIEEARGIIVPWVFHRNGKKISNFYKAWHKACEEAKVPKLLPHDFRRTAVRNMLRAGLDEKRAMSLTGHKTRCVFDRYHIIREDDLRQAASVYLKPPERKEEKQ